MRVQLYVPPGGYFAERWSHGSMMPALGLRPPALPKPVFPRDSAS